MSEMKTTEELLEPTETINGTGLELPRRMVIGRTQRRRHKMSEWRIRKISTGGANLEEEDRS
jgi:hypothetical protein